MKTKLSTMIQGVWFMRKLTGLVLALMMALSLAAGVVAEEEVPADPFEGQYVVFNGKGGETYDMFVITKMHYGADHKVTSVTGHFERATEEEGVEVPEAAEDSEKTYALAADFHADMIVSLFGEFDLIPVTDLYEWYLDAYMERDMYDGHELLFASDLPPEQTDPIAVDFWFVTTHIVVNAQDEIEYMRYCYVPWG